MPEQGAAQPDGDAAADAEDFAARTAAVEGLPLDGRADAFAALHDELRIRLESGVQDGARAAGRADGIHRVARAGHGGERG